MEDFVMVPVPKDRVMDVYALLGEKSSDRVQANGAEPSDDSEAWDAADFRKHVGRSSNTIQGLVKYLADHAGEEVSTTDVADALSLPYGWNSLAGALGAWGRYLKNRDYGFPWDVWWDADGHAVMQMDEAVAAEARKAGF